MANITKEFLKKEGFREYHPAFVDFAKKCFEKRYETEYGDYFLNVKEYEDVYRNGRIVFRGRYEVYARLFRYGTHEPIEMVFDFDNIEDVNNFILELFKNKLIESCEEKS